MIDPNKQTSRIPATIAQLIKKPVNPPQGLHLHPTPDQLHYYVFAEDRQTYGPATLSLLQEWAAQGSINQDTWIYHESTNAWKTASTLKELRQVLPRVTSIQESRCDDILPSQLRRIRLFSDMDDDQVEEFMNYLHKSEVPPHRPVVTKGEPGRFVYLLFQGEATVSTKIDGNYKQLAALQAGDFFGESTLVEEGSYPFDVHAKTGCIFLRLRHRDFQVLLVKQPDLAARFLSAIVRHMSFVIQTTNLRSAQAKAFSKASLSQTGQILLPPVQKKSG
jgi:CRP-like cAMP-binding protein